jgi:hypothetical protein
VRFDPDQNFDKVKIARDPLHGTCIALKISDNQDLLLQAAPHYGFNSGIDFWVFESLTSRKPFTKIEFVGERWLKLYKEGRIKILPFSTFPSFGSINQRDFLIYLLNALRLRGISQLPQPDEILYQAVHAAYEKLWELETSYRVNVQFSLKEDGSFGIPHKRSWPDWYNIWGGLRELERDDEIIKIVSSNSYNDHLITLTVTRPAASKNLVRAQGGPELWDELVTVFLEKSGMTPARIAH